MNRKYTLILIIALLLVAMTMSSCTEKEHVHTLKDTKVAATCISNGYVEHTCTDCGYSYRDTMTEINPKNHSKLTQISVTKPSCEMGYTTYLCEGCRDEVVKEYKDPVHPFGEWQLVDVICTDGGIWERYCTNPECNQKEEKIEAASHIIKHATYVEATEFNSDYYINHCDCGENFYYDSYGQPLSCEYLDFELCEEVGGNFYYKVIGFKAGYENTANVVIPFEVGNIPVTVIDYRAFSNCDSLVSVTLTHNLKTIRETAFELCDNLYNFIFTGTIDEWNKISKGREWESGTVLNAPYIEEKCVEIEGAHYGFLSHSVDATVLASGYLEHYCACGATRYRDTYVAPVGSEALVFELSEDETYYRVVGFNSNKLTADVVIPFDYMGIPVKEIYFEAFMECDVIKTVTLTNNITWIRSTSFAFCDNLQKVIFVGTMNEWTAIEKGDDCGLDSVTVTLYVENK